MLKLLESKIGKNGGTIRKIKINGKIIETPLFMPTINSSNSTWVWQHGMNIGMFVLAINELFERQKLLNEATEYGIHKALDFKGVALIDCGAYYFSTHNIQKNCGEIYKLQRKIKSDIAIVLDEIPFKNLTKKEQQKRIEKTIENAAKIKKINKKIALEAIVHGVTIKQYRECAKRLLEYDFDIYGISVSSKLKIKLYGEAISILKAVRKIIPPEKPIHALGCGSRTMISLLTYHGADIFDSTNYIIKAAYNHYFMEKTYCYKKNQIHDSSNCLVCLETNNHSKENEIGQIKYNLAEIIKENIRLKCAIQNDDLCNYLKDVLPQSLHKYLKR